MANKFSISELERLKKQGNIRDFEEVKKVGGEKGKSKYGNKKTVVDNIEFDSQKEATRYIQLRYLLRAGEITDLQLQVPYELNEGGSHSLVYIADFEYIDARTGFKITEDVKGMRTTIYKKKKKLMFKVYGITIKEI